MKNKKLKSKISLSLLLSSSLAMAQEKDREPASASYSIPTTQQEQEKKDKGSAEAPHYLAGNWGGVRTQLAEKGLEFQIVYKTDFTRNFSGGEKVDNSVLGNLDVRALLDAEKKWGWTGTTFMFYGLGNHLKAGSAPSELIGDTQITNNIEAKIDDFKLYEAYVLKKFDWYGTSILFGLHDLNTEFYSTESSTTLLNSSFGVGKEFAQTGTNGPSIFPYTAPSLRLRIEPSKTTFAQIAIFNAQAGNPDHLKGLHVDATSSEGFLYIAETGTAAENKGVSSKYSIGAWTYSKKMAAINGGTDKSSTGAYGLIDHGFSEDFSVFLRYGFANTEVSPVQSDVGAGFLLKSPLAGHKNDKLSFAITQASAGSDYKKINIDLENAETTLELTYKAELIEGLFVQPDVQYVMNPSFSKTLDPALAGTIRFEFNF